MTKQDYLKLLVESIHSTTIATIGADSHPQTRVIDMMLWDEQGVYFLTAKGKAFYAQLMEQGFIALSATKDKISISLRGKIRNIGSEKLDEIFEKNTYMQSIYPGDTRSALEVFCLYEADGEYFDISDPAHIVRDSFTIGKAAQEARVTMWAKAASAASCATPSARRSASTLPRSRWSSTSTAACTAGGVRKPALNRLSKRGFDYEPERKKTVSHTISAERTSLLSEADHPGGFRAAEYFTARADECP